MFTYCLNNPVTYIDTHGYSACYLIDTIPTCYDQTEAFTSSNPKDSPPDHPNFEAPKKGNLKKRDPNGKGWGWVDKKGNVWKWTPKMHGGEGWTIQQPDGGHSHAYPGGGTRSHYKATWSNDMQRVFSAHQQSVGMNCIPAGLIAGIALGGSVLIMTIAFQERSLI